LEGRSLPSTLTVTNLSDSAAGSLRDAIKQAAPGDMIKFADGLQGTIVLTSGELAITKNLDIEGSGASKLTVSGHNTSRVFDITPGASITLAGLTLANGQAKASSNSGDVFVFGGGIYNAGTLTLSHCTVSDSLAEADASNSNGYLMQAYAYGGGLFNSGTAIVTDCVFTNNSSTYNFSGNGSGSLVTGGGRGGAVGNSGQLTLTDCSLAGNTSSGDGGALFNSGQAEVSGSTFSGNTASNSLSANFLPVNNEVYGGGIANELGTLTLANCTVANNQVMSGLNFVRRQRPDHFRRRRHLQPGRADPHELHGCRQLHYLQRTILRHRPLRRRRRYH
jgi:hypothetical protein